MIVLTFYIAALPVALLCGLLQLGFWLRHREQPAFAWWTMSNLVGLVGAALVVARDHVPWWMSSALGNSIILAATLLVWGGMLRFARRPVPARAFVVFAVAFFAVFHGMWFLTQDLALRVLLTSVGLGLVNAGIAIDLVRSQPQQYLRSRSVLAALFAAHALFYLFRSVTAVTLEANDEFLRSGGIQNLALVIGTVKLLAWNLGVLLMWRELRRAEARSAG